MSEFEYEKQKLIEILEHYKEVIEDTGFVIKRLPELHRNDPRLLALLSKMYENKLRLMKEGLGKPYFARIDFKADDENKLHQCYIGKVGVIDHDNKIVTVDWRAPIASMYYDSNIGRASYEAPEGTITGELQIKRQIDIENGELLRIQDVDTVSNDEILKPYLGVTADNRLKNIVSTIQSEQNEIIREKLGKDLIVQGVAGSGKTTVALHRIAYLVYNHQKNINPDQYMVIGPNTFFLDYISSVLPDLDASTVEQVTFDNLVQDFIEEKITINSSEEQLVQSLNSKIDLSVCKYKNSLKYKELIDKYLIDFAEKVVPNKDFEVKGVPVLSQSVVRKIYDEIEKDRFKTIESRVERAILLLSAYIENTPGLKDKIDSMALGESPTAREFIRKELRNGFKQSLKQYFSKQLKRSATAIYAEFIKKVDAYASIEDKVIINKLKNSTVANLKNKTYDFDDLAALAYLQYSVHGSRDYTKYRHVVVDEAQDYGDFNFYVMKNIIKNSSFSIYGDIAQSIYSYRSIDNWNSVAKIFDEKIVTKELLKSYRTTIEVMEEANHVIRHIGLSPATPVIRNGDEVSYNQTDGNLEETIYNFLLSYIDKGHKSIAIIAKNAEQAQNIHNQLLKHDIPIECIINTKNNYRGGICVTTSYLAKGLEFDAVLIADASEMMYSSDNENDMKLLYVAMTRALHNLDILYNGELTKPLAENLKKKRKEPVLKRTMHN